jgi:titin
LGYIIERCEEGKDNWIRCNAKLVPKLTYKVRNLHLKNSEYDHGLKCICF